MSVTKEIPEQEYLAGLRKEGDALLPKLELELSYSKVDDEINFYDLSGELGKGRYGFRFRSTLYTENIDSLSSSDKMYATNLHFLYRCSFGNHVEIDLAPGFFHLKGIEDNLGLTFSTPIKIQFTDWLALSYRPTLNLIDDRTNNSSDVKLSFFRNRWGVSVGYRSLSSKHHTLEGPYVGVSYRL